MGKTVCRKLIESIREVAEKDSALESYCNDYIKSDIKRTANNLMVAILAVLNVLFLILTITVNSGFCVFSLFGLVLIIYFTLDARIESLWAVRHADKIFDLCSDKTLEKAVENMRKLSEKEKTKKRGGKNGTN